MSAGIRRAPARLAAVVATLVALLAVAATTVGAQSTPDLPDRVSVAGTRGDDIIRVTATGEDTARVSVNGDPVPGTGETPVRITGSAGDDVVQIVNPEGGLFAPDGGVDVAGGAGTDAIEILGGEAEHGSYTVGPTNDAGVFRHVGEDGTQVVRFTGLEPATDTVAEASYTINGTAGDNAITVDNGTANGDGLLRVSIDAFEPVEFENKTSVTVNGDPAPADTGVDTVSFTPTEVSTGLASFSVETGEDAGETITATTAQLPGVLVHLDSGGTIPNVAGVELTAGSASLDAGGDIGTTGAGRVGVALSGALEARSATGGVHVVSAGDLTVADIDSGLPGLATTGGTGNVEVGSSGGSLIVANAGGVESVRSQGGDVSLTANVDILATDDRDFATAAAGDITLGASRDVLLGTVGADHDNDVRASGDITINASRDFRVDGFSDISSDDFGLGTGGDVVVSAGEDLLVSDANGVDASVGASGTAGGDVQLNGPTDRLVELTANSSAAVFSVSGDAVVVADRLLVAADSGITAATGSATVRPVTAGRLVDVGSGTDAAANTLEVSDAELDRMSAGTLRVGDASAGALTVSSSISPAGTSALALLSGGAVAGGAGATISETALRTDSGGGTLLGGAAHDVDTFAAVSAGAPNSVQFTDADGLTIGTVDGVDGISGASGDITLDAGGALTVDRSVLADDLRMQAAGNVSQGAAANQRIDGDGVELISTGGSVAMENDANDVNGLSGATATTFGYVDADEFQTFTGPTVAGVTTTNSDISLRALTGTLGIGQAVDAGTGDVALRADATTALLDVGAAVTGDDIVLAADRIEHTAGGSVGTGATNTVTMYPTTADRPVVLGVAGDAENGTLRLSDAEFDGTTAFQVEVGSSTTGAITTAGAVDPAGTTRLDLRGRGGFSGDGSTVTEDTLTLADEATDGRLWALTATRVDAGSGVGLGYAATTLALTGNAGDDRVDVDGTSATGGTTVAPAGGADDVRLGRPGGTLDTFAGPLTVNGGAGTDALDISDAGDGSANTYTLTASSLTRSGAAPVAHSGFEDVDLAGGNGADAFTVRASPTATFAIEGNDPSSSPGDSLTYDPEGRTVTGNSRGTSGFFDSPGRKRVSYTEIERRSPVVPAARPGAPTVRFTQPSPGELNPNRTVTMAVTTSGGDGGVASVRFALGDRTLCVDTQAPFRCTVRLVAEDVGEESLTARATDRAGQTRTARLAVTVPRFVARRIELEAERDEGEGLPAVLTVSGGVVLPRGVDAQAGCTNARILLTFKRGRRVITTRRVTLDDECRFETTRRFADRRALRRTRAIRVLGRFTGSRALRPRNARTVSVSLG